MYGVFIMVHLKLTGFEKEEISLNEKGQIYNNQYIRVRFFKYKVCSIRANYIYRYGKRS